MRRSGVRFPSAPPPPRSRDVVFAGNGACTKCRPAESPPTDHRPAAKRYGAARGAGCLQTGRGTVSSRSRRPAARLSANMGGAANDRDAVRAERVFARDSQTGRMVRTGAAGKAKAKTAGAALLHRQRVLSAVRRCRQPGGGPCRRPCLRLGVVACGRPGVRRRPAGARHSPRLAGARRTVALHPQGDEAEPRAVVRAHQPVGFPALLKSAVLRCRTQFVPFGPDPALWFSRSESVQAFSVT